MTVVRYDDMVVPQLQFHVLCMYGKRLGLS